MSCRSRDPLRVVAEVTKWQGHTGRAGSADEDGFARLKAEGGDSIID
jgi:rifampin ADP-ribosylating transferase